MTGARSVRVLGPAAGVGAGRLAAVGLSLASLLLTYRLLAPDDFTLFSLVLVLVALGSALASPLNRAFWAGDTAARYGPAVWATALLIVPVLVAGLALAGALSASVSAAVLAAAAFYALARIVERYGYGFLLSQGRAIGAAAPILLFAACDLLVAAGLWAAGSGSLAARLCLPALLFFALLSAAPLRALIGALHGPGLAAQARDFAALHLAPRTATKVIALAAVATLAGAGDRLLAATVPLADAATTAAYLLALSYAVALQTLSAFLFDMARIRVFHDGAWVTGGRAFMLGAAAALALGIAGAVAVHPLLVRLGILPGAIGLALWAGLLCRSAGVTLATLLTVDHFQSGRFGPVATAHGLILAGGSGAYWLLAASGDATVPALLLIATGAGTAAVLLALFVRRAPR